MRFRLAVIYRFDGKFYLISRFNGVSGYLPLVFHTEIFGFFKRGSEKYLPHSIFARTHNERHLKRDKTKIIGG